MCTIVYIQKLYVCTSEQLGVRGEALFKTKTLNNRDVNSLAIPERLGNEPSDINRELCWKPLEWLIGKA